MLKKSPFLLYCLQALDDSHPFKITEFLIGQFPFPDNRGCKLCLWTGTLVETCCTNGLVWLFLKGKMFSINYLLYTQPLSPITLPSQGQ